MKSIQKTFDLVYKHLLTQKRRSLLPSDTSNTCAYRGKGGLKCAVGILIDDAFYHTDLEILSVQFASVKHALACSGVNIRKMKVLKLLSSCQNIHDNVPVKDWKDSLKIIATRFKLKARIIK